METDLETAGLVIVDGTWRNTKTGEMGPVPLAFAEGKLFRGAIEGRGYVLGARYCAPRSSTRWRRRGSIRLMRTSRSPLPALPTNLTPLARFRR